MTKEQTWAIYLAVARAVLLEFLQEETMTPKELDDLELIARHHPIEIFDYIDAPTVLTLIAAVRERDALATRLDSAEREANADHTMLLMMHRRLCAALKLDEAVRVDEAVEAVVAVMGERDALLEQVLLVFKAHMGRFAGEEADALQAHDYEEAALYGRYGNVMKGVMADIEALTQHRGEADWGRDE